MKRCRFDCRYGFFGSSKWAEDVVMEASVCDDESCDDKEGENENTEAASEQTKREHCGGFEQTPEASMKWMLNAFWISVGRDYLRTPRSFVGP